MDACESCRTCLSVQNLNIIFAMPKHSEKYTEVILATTGVMVEFKDELSQHICSQCVNFINQSYKFRKKCAETQQTLLARVQDKISCKPNSQGSVFKSEVENAINIHDLLDDFSDNDDITLDEYATIPTDNVKSEKYAIGNSKVGDVQCSQVTKVKINVDHVDKPIDETNDVKKRGTMKMENQDKKEKKDRMDVTECPMCSKVMSSPSALRLHLKIHRGLNVVCEHCGKKFRSKRRLLFHCKGKHGYEKTDKCSFCDYRASNAEQVKIHERLHTGEKPYICSSCGAGFHRNSSYLQHVAIHLPEKTVQCDQCPARFKSVTLMRIHKNRHRTADFKYNCRVCNKSYARRINAARHLQRIHALQATEEHIDRTKIAPNLDA